MHQQSVRRGAGPGFPGAVRQHQDQFNVTIRSGVINNDADPQAVMPC